MACTDLYHTDLYANRSRFTPDFHIVSFIISRMDLPLSSYRAVTLWQLSPLLGSSFLPFGRWIFSFGIILNILEALVFPDWMCTGLIWEQFMILLNILNLS